MSRMLRKSRKSRRSRKVVSTISNITFAITILLAVYIFVSTFLLRRSLLPGVCPIDNNRTLLYIAVGFGVVTFVLSFFEIKGKAGKGKPVDTESVETEELAEPEETADKADLTDKED